MVSNSLGLDVHKAEELSIKLNDLLANFQVFYQNHRGIHWNIRGKRFLTFMLSLKSFIMMLK